jgi:Protein of unknown function (DUF1236).
MINRFMMSVAAVALIAGAGFANAQGTGTNREQGSTAQQSAPSSDRGNSAQSKPSSDMKATQSEDKSPGAARNQRAEDKAQGPKSKSMSSENESKGGKDLKAKDMKAEGQGGKDMKAEGKSGKDMKVEGQGGKDMKAEQKGAADSKSTTGQSQTGQASQSGKSTQSGQSAPQSQTGQTITQSQGGTSVQSQTIGQAGAAAKLSTEQRTQITTVIRDQHVAPLTNVNFSIAVGTRVPRDVSFHVLPERVVAIYPEWRGFKFVVVREQILIIDPNTFEIVAILEV